MASLRARAPGSVLGLLKLTASGGRVNPASFGLPRYSRESIEVASQRGCVGSIGANSPMAASVLPVFGRGVSSLRISTFCISSFLHSSCGEYQAPRGKPCGGISPVDAAPEARLLVRRVSGDAKKDNFGQPNFVGAPLSCQNLLGACSFFLYPLVGATRARGFSRTSFWNPPLQWTVSSRPTPLSGRRPNSSRSPVQI